MNVIARVLNFVFGLTAVMLILLGATTAEATHKTQMLAIGTGLFILTLIIHIIQQMMSKANK